MSEMSFWAKAARKACAIFIQLLATADLLRIVGPDVALWQIVIIGAVVGGSYSFANGENYLTGRRS